MEPVTFRLVTYCTSQMPYHMRKKVYNNPSIYSKDCGFFAVNVKYVDKTDCRELY
jgi:hypothetical protein